jgi:hypothetical protein
MHLKIDRSQSL